MSNDRKYTFMTVELKTGCLFYADVQCFNIVQSILNSNKKKTLRFCFDVYKHI